MSAQEYLKDHGLTEEFATSLGLTWDDNYLVIPVKDEEGNHLFNKSRDLLYDKSPEHPQKYKNELGSHATLYNYHAVKTEPNLVITEGEIDCLRLLQAGIPAISPTSGSGTFNPEWVPLLQDKRIWVVFDNDEAGQKGLRGILNLLPNARVVTLPETYKDVCEFFQDPENTKHEFIALMRNAQTKSEWETSHLPADFNLISASDIYKLDIQEQPWLIDKVLYSEGFCFIYGAEGTGKSYIALSIAQAVATGTPWLGKFATRQGNVLFLDKENPVSMTQRRLKGMSMDLDNVYWLEYPEKFRLSDGQGGLSEFAQALSTIVTTKKIDLIIIDSFVDLMEGNENSSGDTQEFFNAIKVLFPRIAYLPLHHENKPSQGVFRSDSQRTRGSSNINAQTFTMFRLEPVAKSKTDITLKQTKARDAQRLDKFMVRMLVKDLPDGKTTVSGFEYVGEVIEGDLDAGKTSEVEEMIQEMAGLAPFITRTQILEMAQAKGISSRTADNTIKKMVENGNLNPIKKDGREKRFTAGMFVDEIEDPTQIFDGSLDGLN